MCSPPHGFWSHNALQGVRERWSEVLQLAMPPTHRAVRRSSCARRKACVSSHELWRSTARVTLPTLCPLPLSPAAPALSLSGFAPVLAASVAEMASTDPATRWISRSRIPQHASRIYIRSRAHVGRKLLMAGSSTDACCSVASIPAFVLLSDCDKRDVLRASRRASDWTLLHSSPNSHPSAH